MSNALLLVRVDYQFTPHIQIVVRSGPKVMSTLMHFYMKTHRIRCDFDGVSALYIQLDAYRCILMYVFSYKNALV